MIPWWGWLIFAAGVYFIVDAIDRAAHRIVAQLEVLESAVDAVQTSVSVLDKK